MLKFFIVVLVGFASIAWTQIERNVLKHDAGTKEEFSITSNLHVVDAQGKSLGEPKFHGLNYLSVVFKINNSFIEFLNVGLYKWGFEKDISSEIGFATLDCTGQGYFLYPSTELIIKGASITSPGSTLWVFEPQAVPEVVVIYSRLFSQDCSLFDYGEEQIVFKARPLVDLETIFTPPFRLEKKR